MGKFMLVSIHPLLVIPEYIHMSLLKSRNDTSLKIIQKKPYRGSMAFAPTTFEEFRFVTCDIECPHAIITLNDRYAIVDRMKVMKDLGSSEGLREVGIFAFTISESTLEAFRVKADFGASSVIPEGN